MLILSRRGGQEVTVGAEMRIRVLSVRGGKVQLGITAPDHIPVHRAEVAKAMRAKGGDRGGRSLAGRRQSRRGS